MTWINLDELMKPDAQLKKLREKHGRLPCPEPDCNGELILRRSKHGLMWGCIRYPACMAAHGAHPDGTPLGIPADKKTKRARIKAHAAFDELWNKASKKGRVAARRGAYRWLREQLGMTEEECHIARFDVATCARVVVLCKARLEESTMATKPKEKDINDGRCPSVSHQGIRCGQWEGHDGPHTALGPSDAPWMGGDGRDDPRRNQPKAR